MQKKPFIFGAENEGKIPHDDAEMKEKISIHRMTVVYVPAEKTQEDLSIAHFRRERKPRSDAETYPKPTLFAINCTT